ncbi:uncharacterized protein LOC134834338 [Culicoides brevitarsis]|uniref:uncharacterized protein LOC134834338 n=1 Tax=Culicoides brevitarsis TaxID=469753 RepID=UPI00307C6CCD
MRTSSCEENNAEVKGHLQSESHENQQVSSQNSTSSSTTNANNHLSDSSFDYVTETDQKTCRGCLCRQNHQKFILQSKQERQKLPENFLCACAPDEICCCLGDAPDTISPILNNPRYESAENRDIAFNLLKNAKPVRPVTINKDLTSKRVCDSDSDVEIIEETIEERVFFNPKAVAYKNLLLRQTKFSAIKKIVTQPRPKRARKEINLGESVALPASTKGRKRKSSESDEFSATKISRTEFVDCGSTTESHRKYDEDPKPCSSTTNDTFLQQGSSTNDDKTMSMYDYRFTDPQLPSSTSYYSSSTNATKTGATEDQQNSSNATTQNLLDSNKTIATLCNIGNSCYLNSVVYTLRFAPLFLHKLHHLIEDMATIYIKLNPTKHKSSSLGRNVSLWQGHSGRSWSSKDLASLGSITGNDSVPKNNRLIVTEKLHELYQNLHKNESSLNTEPFHAGTFLQAIQEVCSIFEGNQQQDAHECLMCILDSIRETCDTLATAIIEQPEQLLAEYGLGSLIEETRAADESLQQQSTLQQLQQQVSSGSSSSKGFGKFLSRKSKRKKSDDETTTTTVANTSPVNPDKPPESPSKDRNAAGDAAEILNNHEEEGSSTATSPTTTIDAKLSMKNAILKVLAGEQDVNDKQKLKENVCKLLGLNFFCEDFEGVTVSSIKCLTCEQVKTLKEKMIDISVPITGHENPDSMSNPQSFFQNSCITKEYFRGENKYRCENCFGYTEAIRSITYEILPRLLVIHLKRFSGGMEKINSYIPTPFTLKCFCNSCFNLPDEEKLHIYKLYSVITHVGATMSVGHYVAYTCALDIHNEYRTCTNDRSKIATLFQQQRNGGGNGSGDASNDTASSQTSGSNSSLAANNAAGTTQNGAITDKIANKTFKRFFFSSKKANSSNDLKSNSFKSNVNGLVNKVVANGMEKLNLGINNTTGRVLGSSNGTSAAMCQGQKCCGIKENKLVSNNNGTSFVSYVNGTNHVNGSNGSNGSHTEMDTLAAPPTTKPSSSDLSIASSSNSSTNNHVPDDDSTVTSTTTASATISPAAATKMAHVSNITQDHWYMCDDDKIKVMQQQQFEEHLSPTRKNMITPYLLFYARFDAHPL